MTLPEHVCRILSCSNTLARDEFSAHLESLGSHALPAFLADQSIKDQLVAFIFDAVPALELRSLELVDSVKLPLYLEVGDSGGGFRGLLKLPGTGDALSGLPTAALAALARVWVCVPDLLEEDGDFDVKQRYRDKLLILEEGQVSGRDGKDFDQLLAALLVCKLKVSALPKEPHWVSFARIEISAGALASDKDLIPGRLMQEVLSESRVRWRYVALYRIFESAYLVGLRQRLLSEFLQSPQEELANAQKALESELSSFKALVEEKKLEAQFDAIRSAVDGARQNKFLLAIKRALRHSKSSMHTTGVEYAYKIRCAIVHAGQKDVVFDRYEDAEEGVELVLSIMEEAVFELLGLRGR
jgi:hypothetical protein